MGSFKVKAFGVTKEILGKKETVIQVDAATVEELKNFLFSTYPRLANLKSLFIAVNHNYAEGAQTIKESDEIALIPPVSGG